MEYLNVETNNRVATVTVNRPEAMNALTFDTIEDLVETFEGLISDEGVDAIVITGAGPKAFIAGGDLTQLIELTPLEARELAQVAHVLMEMIENGPKPVIAAINGYCLGGGCELASACDIRIASSNAKFGQPEVNIGIIPGFGGTQRLPRIVGSGMAMEMILTGEMIDAEEALRINLVNRITSPGELLDVAQKMGEIISTKGPEAVRMSKEAIRSGLATDLAAGCKIETDLFALGFSSPEQKEGMSAFLEKRPAKFR